MVRVCSDNPFLQPDSFKTLLNAHDELPAELAFGFEDGSLPLNRIWDCLQKLLRWMP